MTDVATHLGMQEGRAYSYSILIAFHTLPVYFKGNEIFQFYNEYRDATLRFTDNITISLAEIFFRCQPLHAAIDDYFFSVIYTRYFALLNSIDIAGFSTTGSFDFYGFNTHLEKISETTALSKIPCSDRVVRLINSEQLSPFMFENINSAAIRIHQCTFSFLLAAGVDVSSLMVYNFSSPEEIRRLSRKMKTTPTLRKQCAEYIEDQGVINTTMFIIASLLGLKNSLNSTKMIDCSSIANLFCVEHGSALYRPFSSFRDSSDGSRCELYYSYLRPKRCLDADISDIREVFDEISIADKEEGIILPGRQSDRAESVLSLADEYGQHSLSFLSSLSAGECAGQRCSEMGILNILQLTLERDVDFGFHCKAFDVLMDFPASHTLQQKFRRYCKEIIQSGIDTGSGRHSELFSAIRTILDYLGYTKESGKVGEPQAPFLCSFDPNTSIIFTSDIEVDADGDVFLCSTPIHSPAIEECGDELAGKANAPEGVGVSSLVSAHSEDGRDKKIPLIHFADFPWLTDDDKSVILDNYIHHFSLFDLVDEFLSARAFSPGACEFFKTRHQEIRCPVTRALVMCKLSLEISPQSLLAKDMRTVMDRADSLFAMRHIILHDNIPGRFYKKFIDNLTLEQEAHIADTIRSERVNENFICAYLPHLFSKYDLIYIIDHLVFFIENYPKKVVLKIQKHLLQFTEDMFFTDNYLLQITLLYKKLLRNSSVEVQGANEHILAAMTRCGKALDREVFIGNLKEKE